MTIKQLKVLFWITITWIFALVGISAYFVLNSDAMGTQIGRIVGGIVVADVLGYIMLMVAYRKQI